MTVTPPQLGRPVGATGERTRARIIAAAMRCVAEVGYSRATIRAIARIADMTSGSLYHYFPNKSALLEATVREVDDIALPRLRAAAAQAGDAVHRLTAVLDELGRLMADYPYLAAFDRAVGAERTAHPHGVRPAYPSLKALRDIISDVVGQAALPKGIGADAATDAVYALTRGLTERATSLDPEAYAAALRSAQELISGTFFVRAAGGRSS